MRLVLWVLVLFIATVIVVALAVEEYDIYIIVKILNHKEIELSPNFVVIGFITSFVILYFLVRILISSLNYRSTRAESLLLASIKAFFEGNYTYAQKNAEKGFKLAKIPLIQAINSVIAIRSAQYTGDLDTRNKLLKLADQTLQHEKTLRLVTKAEMLLNDGHYSDTLETLTDLHTAYSTGNIPTAILELELEAQRQVGNWDAILEITSTLIQRRPLNQNHLEEIRHKAHLENFKIKAKDLDALNEYWNSLSETDQKNNHVAIAATRAYIALGQCSTAHQIIEQNVQKSWDPELVALYSECLNNHVSKQIECAELWLKEQPNNAVLLLTLGKLCMHCELWGKAQSYLEASLSIEPTPAAYFALALLNEKLGKKESATEHYNKALELAMKHHSTN